MEAHRPLTPPSPISPISPTKVGLGRLAGLALPAVLALLGVLGSGACNGNTFWRDGARDGARDRAGGVDHVATGPVSGRDAAEFSLVTGVTSVSVTGADLGDTLYRISTPADSSLYPAVVDDGAHVQLHLKKSSDNGPEAVQIELNSGVRWRLRFDAGVTTNLIDMTAGRIDAVDLSAGVTRVELRLPKPAGTVTVRLGGGANEFVVTVPAGTPAQARIGNGAGTVVIDGVSKPGVAAGTFFPADGYESTVDRYSIDLATGVSTFRLDHR